MPSELCLDVSTASTCNVNGVIRNKSGDEVTVPVIRCALSAWDESSPEFRVVPFLLGGTNEFRIEADDDGRFVLPGISRHLAYSFRLSGDAPKGTICAFASDLDQVGSLSGRYRATRDGVFNLVATIEDLPSMRVRVRDATGAPLSNCAVSVQIELFQSGLSWIADVEATRHRGGEVWFSPSPAPGESWTTLLGKRCWLSAIGEDGTAAYECVAFAEGLEVTLHPASPSSPGKFEGLVVDCESGEPLSGVVLELGHTSSKSRRLRKTKTSSDGTFEFIAFPSPDPSWLRGRNDMPTFVVIAENDVLSRTIRWLHSQDREIHRGLIHGFPVSSESRITIELKR
jgi:hypothetical protein